MHSFVECSWSSKIILNYSYSIVYVILCIFMKNMQHILTQLYTSCISKNQALSFLIHYMFFRFIILFIITILSPSLLFKIVMVSSYFGLDSRLDFRLDPTYLLQLRKFSEFFLRLCYLQNNSMHWKFEMKNYTETICNYFLASSHQIAIFLSSVHIIS